MQDVPKIVLERLNAEALPADHPDAGLLTAFAEHSLSQSERASVMVHIARCVDCRDIVALALPPTEATQLIITPARGWFTWPALRWGFVAVGVVAIASIGVLQYQRGQAQKSAALSSITRTESVANEAKNQLPTPAAVSQPSGTEKQPAAEASADAIGGNSKPAKNEPKQLNTASEPRSSAASSRSGLDIAEALKRGKVHAGPSFPSQQQQQQQIPSTGAQNAFAQAAPISTTQASVSAPTSPAGQAVPVTVTSQPSANDAEAQATNATVAGQIEEAEDKVLRSKPPETVTVEVSSAAPVAETSDSSQQEMPKAIGDPSNGRNLTALVALVPASQFRWAISPAGSLQRSSDGGSTWQNVNVVSNLAPTSNLAYAANVVAVAKAKKNENTHKSIASPIFHAVTAAGPDVWAGGSNAALYHSADGGDHWTQVLPSDASTALTGDIVSLEFPDPQHGKVTTSTPEVWTTSDAGQTWQKQ
jgi:hypothetical protein